MLFSILGICLLGSHFACKRHHKILNVLSTHTHTGTHTSALALTPLHLYSYTHTHTQICVRKSREGEKSGGKLTDLANTTNPKPIDAFDSWASNVPLAWRAALLFYFYARWHFWLLLPTSCLTLPPSPTLLPPQPNSTLTPCDPVASEASFSLFQLAARALHYITTWPEWVRSIRIQARTPCPHPHPYPCPCPCPCPGKWESGTDRQTWLFRRLAFRPFVVCPFLFECECECECQVSVWVLGLFMASGFEWNGCWLLGDH